MKRAEHSVNVGLPFAVAALPSVVGVDLASTVPRVIAWGGDASLYAWSLSQVELTQENARGLATISGWRAGVVGLRGAALALARQLDGAASALGLAGSELDAFLVGQSTDPFAWPRPQPVLATVGGFRGFGGPWVTPPTAAAAIRPGEFRITTGTERWSIVADIFGARISAATDEFEVDPLSQGHGVVALVSAGSYLVRLVRR